VVTRALPNDCCGQKCFPSAVYHKGELAAIEAVNDKRCTSEERDRCPRPKCSKPAQDTKAVCEQGQCKPRQVPWSEM